MTIQQKSLSEVSHEAIRLLSEKIGVADTLRFIGQFSVGHGNYTEERDAMFGQHSLDDILDQIKHPQNPAGESGTELTNKTNPSSSYGA